MFSGEYGKFQAHRLGMVGDRYVWILHYGNDPYWMKKATADGACAAELITSVANRHFVTKDVTLREDDLVTVAGMVSVPMFLVVQSRLGYFEHLVMAASACGSGKLVRPDVSAL